MKTISILLSLVNSLLAGLLLTYTLSGSEVHQSGTLWFVIKSGAALLVILIGILTWFAGAGTINPSPVFVGGLLLLILGAVTIVWTYHLAVLNGDMEYYMVVFGGSLMIQGLASLLGFGADSRTMTIS